MQRDLNILCLTWNTESVPLCQDSATRVEPSTSTWDATRKLLSGAPLPCEPPDFLDNLMQEVRQPASGRRYDIVVVGFQEDAQPGSQFHSHALFNAMQKANFRLYARDKQMGLGVTTWKAAKNWTVKVRGLRMSVYINNESAALRNTSSDTAQTPVVKGFQSCEGKDEWTKGKGAQYILLPIGEYKIMFVNSHLPFNSKSLKQSARQKSTNPREEGASKQIDCLRHIVETVARAPYYADYIILMGDLNFRLIGYDALKLFNEMLRNGQSAPEALKHVYETYDELKQLRDKDSELADLLADFKEGVNNEGPMFEPTCKMRKLRESGCSMTQDNANRCYKLGVENQRAASWCDRILYATINNKVRAQNTMAMSDMIGDGEQEDEFVVLETDMVKTAPSMVCLSYRRWEYGETMRYSDHSGVMAVFTIPSSGF